MAETNHSNVTGCFIWQLQRASYRRTNLSSWIRTTETSWWRTTEKLLGISFEACLRHCRDVPMGCRCYVLLRRRPDVPIRHCEDACLDNLPPKCCWVFHLILACDVAGTYTETSLRRFHDVLLPDRSIFKW